MSANFSMDVPKNAEAQFLLECTTIGAQCSKANPDERGWDFFVEFPSHIQTLNSPDVNYAPIRCLVQVKSTTSRKAHTDIKVSNALEFAKTPMPCFVVLYEYDASKARLKKIHWLHFWKKEISRALERSRILSEVDQKPLNKATIRLRISESIAKPGSLLNDIRKTIADYGSGYETAKRLVYENVGVSATPLKGQLEFKDNISVAELTDSMMKTDENIKAKRLSFFEERFGIVSRNPVWQEFDLDVNLNVVPIPARINVTSKSSGRSIDLNAKLLRPSMAVEPRDFVIRIVNEIVDVVMHPHHDQGRFSFHAHVGEKVLSCDTFYTACRLADILAEGYVKIRVTYDVDGEENWVSSHVDVEDGHNYAAYEIFRRFFDKVAELLGSADRLSELEMRTKDIGTLGARISMTNSWFFEKRIQGKFAGVDGRIATGEGRCVYTIPVYFKKGGLYFLGSRGAQISADADGSLSATLSNYDYLKCWVVKQHVDEGNIEILEELNRVFLGSGTVPPADMLFEDVVKFSAFETEQGFSFPSPF